MSWPHIGRIDAQTSIERALRQCAARLQVESGLRPGAAVIGRRAAGLEAPVGIAATSPFVTAPVPAPQRAPVQEEEQVQEAAVSLPCERPGGEHMNAAAELTRRRPPPLSWVPSAYGVDTPAQCSASRKGAPDGEQDGVSIVLRDRTIRAEAGSGGLGEVSMTGETGSVRRGGSDEQAGQAPRPSPLGWVVSQGGGGVRQKCD